MKNSLLLILLLSTYLSHRAQNDSVKKNFNQLTMEQFSQITGNKNNLVLVDFRADWCVVCKKQEPLLELLAKENSGIEILVIDMDDNPLIAESFEVDALPVNLLFRKGQLVWNRIGFRSLEELRQTIRQYNY